MITSRALVGLTGFALAASVTAGPSPATALEPPSAPAAADPRGSGAGRGPATATRVDPVERAQVRPCRRRRAGRRRPDRDADVVPLPADAAALPRQPRRRRPHRGAAGPPRPRAAAHGADEASATGSRRRSSASPPRGATSTWSPSPRRRARPRPPSRRPGATRSRTTRTAAATDTALLAQYKTPIWISNNIHGNEWEGTDAAMRYIEHLATAPMSEVGAHPAQQPPLLLAVAQPRRPHQRDPRHRAGPGPQPRHDHQHDAGDAVVHPHGAGDPADLRRRLPRLHQRAPAGALRPAARLQLRVRPLHARTTTRSRSRSSRTSSPRRSPATPTTTSTTGAGGRRANTGRDRAHQDPLPRHPGRLGRLPADLHRAVRRVLRRRRPRPSSCR